MTSSLRFAFAAAALALALGACQGSFGSGGTAAPGGMAPPVNGPAPGQMNPSPVATGSMSPPPGMTMSESNAQSVQLPFDHAQKGLACPSQNGYSCTLYFNMSDEQLAALDAPSPRPNGKHAKPTPSPTPTPTPDPSPSASGSPSPSPSPSASPQMSIALTASPKDAPAMVNPDPKAVATVALVALRLKTTSDIILQGNSSARFTLPKEQVGGRGFAIQLFHETVKKKNKVSDNFVGSYKESKLDGSTLIFSFKAPKIQVKKDETWLVVLYGDELPSSSASPQASGSPAASTSPAASAAPSVSPSAAP